MGTVNVAAGAGRYVEWGVVQISVANLVLVGLMLALFVLALLAPFPGRHRDEPRKRP